MDKFLLAACLLTIASVAVADECISMEAHDPRIFKIAKVLGMSDERAREFSNAGATFSHKGKYLALRKHIQTDLTDDNQWEYVGVWNHRKLAVDENGVVRVVNIDKARFNRLTGEYQERVNGVWVSLGQSRSHTIQ